MTRVRFIRAPRGDAVVPPPAVGPQSVLGASIRAAREDHTHEGVHRIVAGAGVAITPSSGLGDVTLEVLHWRPPVQLVTNLPPTGNQPGDARVVLSEAAIYVWTGATWQRVAPGDGGGGGGGGVSGVVQQIAKVGVVASGTNAYVVEVLVPATTDFAHPPVEVLRLNPTQGEESIALTRFDNTDAIGFVPDPMVGFDAPGMALKTTVPMAFTQEAVLSDGAIWAADIGKPE